MHLSQKREGVAAAAIANGDNKSLMGRAFVNTWEKIYPHGQKDWMRNVTCQRKITVEDESKAKKSF